MQFKAYGVQHTKQGSEMVVVTECEARVMTEEVMVKLAEHYVTKHEDYDTFMVELGLPVKYTFVRLSDGDWLVSEFEVTDPFNPVMICFGFVKQIFDEATKH